MTSISSNMVDSKKLSIRDRIRAMNSTLDMVDQEQPTISSLRAVLGISSSDSSLTDTSSLRQKDQASTDGNGTKDFKSSELNKPVQKRSSVVEIWRQREGKPPLNADTARTDVHNIQQARPSKFTADSPADTKEHTTKRFDQLGSSNFPSYRKSPYGEEKKEIDSFEADTESFTSDNKYKSSEETTMNYRGPSLHVPQNPKTYKVRSNLSQDSEQLSDVTSKTYTSSTDLVNKNPTSIIEESSSSDFADILSKFDKTKSLVSKTSSGTKNGNTNSRLMSQGIFRESNTTIESEAPTDQLRESIPDTSCADQIDLKQDPDDDTIQSDGPKVKSILKKKQSTNIWHQKMTNEKQGGSREEEPSNVEGIGTSMKIQWNQRLKASTADESKGLNSKHFSKPPVDLEAEHRPRVSSSLTPDKLKKAKALTEQQSDTTKPKNKVDLIKSQLEASKKSSKLGLDKGTITNVVSVTNPSVVPVEYQKSLMQTSTTEIGKQDQPMKSLRDAPQRNSTETTMSKQIPKDTTKSEINRQEPKSVIDRWKQSTKESNNKESNSNSYAVDRTWYSRKTFSPRQGLKKTQREQDERVESTKETKATASTSRVDVLASPQSKPVRQNLGTGETIPVESINAREFWKAKAAVSPKIDVSISSTVPVEPPTILPRGSNNLRIASPRASPKKKVSKGAIFNPKTGEYERIRNPVFFRDESQERSDSFVNNDRPDPVDKDHKSMHIVDSEDNPIQSNDFALKHCNITPTHGFERGEASDSGENAQTDNIDFENSKRNNITEKLLWMESSESATSFTDESVSSDDLSRYINVPPSQKGQKEVIANHKILQQWRLASKTVDHLHAVSNAEVLTKGSHIHENEEKVIRYSPAQSFFAHKPLTSTGEEKSEETIDTNTITNVNKVLENQTIVNQQFDQGDTSRRLSFEDTNFNAGESTSTSDNLSRPNAAHNSDASLNSTGNIVVATEVKQKHCRNPEIKSFDDSNIISESEFEGRQNSDRSSFARQSNMSHINDDWYESEHKVKVTEGPLISDTLEKRRFTEFLDEQYTNNADHDAGLSSLSDAASDPTLDGVLLHSDSNAVGPSNNTSQPKLHENLQHDPYNEIYAEASSKREDADSKFNSTLSKSDGEPSFSEIPVIDSSEDSLLITKIEAHSGLCRTNGRSRSANPSNRRWTTGSALDRIAVRSLSPPGSRSNHSLSESGIDEEYITRRASLWVEVQRRKRQSRRFSVNSQHESEETTFDFNNMNENENSPKENKRFQSNESVQPRGRNSKGTGKTRPNIFSLTLSSAKLASALERKNLTPSNDSGPPEKSPSRQRYKKNEIEIESKSPCKNLQQPDEMTAKSMQQMSSAGEYDSVTKSVSATRDSCAQNGKSAKINPNQSAGDTSTMLPVVDHWSSNNSYHTDASSTTNESNQNSKPSRKSKKNFVLLGRKHLIKQAHEKKVEDRQFVSLEQQSVAEQQKQEKSMQEPNRMTALSAMHNESITTSTPKPTSSSKENDIEETTKRKISATQLVKNGRKQSEHSSGSSSVAELSPNCHLEPPSHEKPVIEEHEASQVSVTLSLSSTSDQASGLRRKTRSKSLSSESKKALMSRSRALSPQAVATVKKDTMSDSKKDRMSDSKVSQKKSSSMSKKEAIARHSLQRRTLFKHAEVRSDKQNAVDPEGIYFLPRTKLNDESNAITPQNAVRNARGSLLTPKPLGEKYSIFSDVNRQNKTIHGESMSLPQKSQSAGIQEVNPDKNASLLNRNNDAPQNQKTGVYQKEAKAVSATGKDSNGSLIEWRRAVKDTDNRGAGHPESSNELKPNIFPNHSLYAMNENEVSHALTSKKSHDASVQSILSGDSSGARSTSSLAGRAGTILKGRRQKESYNMITHDAKSVQKQDVALGGRSLSQSDRVVLDIPTQKNPVPQEAAALRKVLERNERVKSSFRDSTRKTHGSPFIGKKEDPLTQEASNKDTLKEKVIGKGKTSGKQNDARLSKRYNRSSRFMENDLSTVMTPFGLTSDGASENIQHSQSTATAESSFISIETGSTESDSKYQPTETGRSKPSSDEKRRSPTNLVSNQFLKERAHNFDQVHSVCKNVTVQDLADDLVGEVNQVSEDLRNFASGINDRMAALRDCVTRTNESTSDSLLPKCQNLVPFDMEDVAIEVEYLDDSIDEDEEFDDDPAEDFGMCTAHVDQTIDNVDDALGHIRPSITCANSPTGQDSDSESESESEIEVRNTNQPFIRPQCV